MVHELKIKIKVWPKGGDLTAKYLLVVLAQLLQKL